jgi:hypothetical protein
MHLKTLVLVALSALLLLVPSSVLAAPCCDGKACCEDKACCQAKADNDCCKDKDCCKGMACCTKAGDELAASVLLPRIETQAPARQAIVVWFMKPTMIGREVLQGQYLIEHDNDRMAKGLPCTHIYAASKPQVPVVTFHCTHLERVRADLNTLVVESTGDAMIPAKLQAFQFAGETAAHGVPTGR